MSFPLLVMLLSLGAWLYLRQQGLVEDKHVPIMWAIGVGAVGLLAFFGLVSLDPVRQLLLPLLVGPMAAEPLWARIQRFLAGQREKRLAYERLKAEERKQRRRKRKKATSSEQSPADSSEDEKP